MHLLYAFEDAHLLAIRLGLFAFAQTQLGRFDQERFLRRQKLVQRRIEQTDRHRKARHRFQDAEKIFALKWQEFFQRVGARFVRVGEYHLLNDGEPLRLHEHVLGAAEADARGAQFARLDRILRRIRIGPYFKRAQFVGPAQKRR